MKVIDWEWCEKARDLWLKFRNLKKVHRELQKKGYTGTYSTVHNWWQKYQSEWKELALQYDLKKKETTISARTFEDTLLNELVDLKEPLLERLKDNLYNESAEDEKEKKINTQAGFFLDKLIARILDLIERLESKSNNTIEKDNALLDVLFADPVIGRELKLRWDDISAKVEKRIKK
jgi:cell fate (sporulation/competence/biofilm development) regulator YlbF (YheA/YmcA/DUF963 family)